MSGLSCSRVNAKCTTAKIFGNLHVSDNELAQLQNQALQGDVRSEKARIARLHKQLFHREGEQGFFNLASNTP